MAGRSALHLSRSAACANELALLQRLRPDAEFSTPLTKLAQRGVPSGLTAIAVSISNSGDLSRHGLTAEHEKTLSEELHLYLLMAGLQIAYGGALRGDFSQSRKNFTMLLFELVKSYSGLAQQVGAHGLKPIANYAPWPLRLGYGRKEYRLFGKDAELIEGPEPDKLEVPEDPALLFPEVSGEFRFKSGSPEQRLAWTRGLTAMRAQMTDATNANGVEEAVALATERGMIIDDTVQDLRDDLNPTGRLLQPENLVHEIAAQRGVGLETALNNGLSDTENRELFHTAHPPRIAELVLTGLSRLSGRTA